MVSSLNLLVERYRGARARVKNVKETLPVSGRVIRRLLIAISEWQRLRGLVQREWKVTGRLRTEAVAFRNWDAIGILLLLGTSTSGASRQSRADGLLFRCGLPGWKRSSSPCRGPEPGLLSDMSLRGERLTIYAVPSAQAPQECIACRSRWRAQRSFVKGLLGAVRWPCA
jgi:hypothetical protein